MAGKSLDACFSHPTKSSIFFQIQCKLIPENKCYAKPTNYCMHFLAALIYEHFPTKAPEWRSFLSCLLELCWRLHLHSFRFFFSSSLFVSEYLGGLQCHPCSVQTSWPSLLLCGTALLVGSLSANARAVLCLREYAEIKWPQFSVVNHRRRRMSAEVSPEHTVCQDEEACWSLTDRGLEDNTCAFLIDIGGVPLTARLCWGRAVVICQSCSSVCTGGFSGRNCCRGVAYYFPAYILWNNVRLVFK